MFEPGVVAQRRVAGVMVMTSELDGAAPSALPLKGRRVLVTAGPTFEPIDPVRGLTNRSSGRQGYAIAEALAELGAEVTLISGPVGLSTPAAVRRVSVITAEEMLEACRAALPVDAAVMTAAVADWRPAAVAPVKLSRDDGPPELRLVANPDILSTLSRPGPERPALVIGFAAETDAVEAHGRDKLTRKGCDWIVAADVTRPGALGGEENAVTLITREGAESWPRAAKSDIARRLAKRMAGVLKG